MEVKSVEEYYDVIENTEYGSYFGSHIDKYPNYVKTTDKIEKVSKTFFN